MIFSFIKSVFSAFLRLGRPLVTQNVKCISLNKEPCLPRPTIIDLNLYELHYYLFMLCFGSRCTLEGSSIVIFDLSNKHCTPRETENLYAKVFNIITGITE